VKALAPHLWCLTSAVLFGAATPAAKILLGQAGPLTLAGLLYLGAGLTMLAPAIRARDHASRWDFANAALVTGAVVCGGLVAPAVLLVGLSLAPAASVALWLNLEVVGTAVLAWLFFREHLGALGWLAVALVVLAGGVLAGPSGSGTPMAALLVAIACLFWALDNNLTALVDRFTPAQVVVAKGFAAGAVNLGLGLRFEGGLPDARGVVAALLVGALGYGVSLALYIRGAQHLGAARSQMLFAMAPFVGTILAWTILGEHVHGAQLGAGAVMATGVGALVLARHGHVHAHRRVEHTHSHRHDDGHHAHAHPELPASARHTHGHVHEPVTHAHPHVPDLHHRHGH
jgi:drug/metabolite transporter (DMT)-like permease